MTLPYKDIPMCMLIYTRTYSIYVLIVFLIVLLGRASANICTASQTLCSAEMCSYALHATYISLK